MLSLLLIIVTGLVLVISSAYLFYRWDWKALFIFAPVLIYYAISWEGGTGFPSLITPIIIGAAGGFAFRRGLQFKVYLVVTSLVIAGLVSGNYYYLKQYKNIDVVNLSKTEMIKILDKNSVSEDVKKQVAEDYDRWMDVFSDVIPFTSFLYSLIFSSLCYLVMKVFFIRLTGKLRTGGIEQFRLNDYFIFFLIAGWALFLLIDKSDYYMVNTAGLNIALIASLLYAVQGLGVIKFLLIKKGLPLYIIPLGFFIIMIFGFGALTFLVIMLAGFGALDLWADFRKFNTRDST